ncbi:MAG: bifunctional phosphopantothenoylcysteine decarboxylase/phosphopantothenate--cysteine ligase CoaBC [Methanobacteriota archaeon]|nr:MAG: bifunctional phosphopantothenoylcysteine decarboxylase/phosphopantothenate--cysteine ligase CoaBC [Euryarchaeota archaeon]
MHPANALKCSKSEKLKDRRIVLGVTGSIAAVESVKLCRELIRHGAEVHVVMSADAQKILHPYALEFASGRPVTTEIDGRVQHVALCGSVTDRVDMLLIAPATANTISKIACGIDDTTVTTFATTALGTGIPVMVVPAMHGSMIRHKIVLRNIDCLKDLGVIVLDCSLDEAKAKMPSTDEIVAKTISRAGRGDMRGVKVLVIAGSTEEPLDDIRVLTNRSSGETGVELAKAAYERGADVELWMGRCGVAIPSYLTTKRFSTAVELEGMIDDKAGADIVLFPAAVSDYRPDRYNGKMPSTNDTVTLTLSKTPKLVDKVVGATVVAFKAQSRAQESQLVQEAVELIERAGCSFAVANRMEDVERGMTRALIVERDGSVEEVSGSKAAVAEKILDRSLKG